SFGNPEGVTHAGWSRRDLEAEPTHLVTEALHVAELDVLVAADDVGQVRQLHGALVALGRERGQRLLDEGAVLADELTLDATDLGRAERIERGAAQAPQSDQRPERGIEPALAELQLVLEPHGAQQGRVELVVDLDAGGILVGQLS